MEESGIFDRASQMYGGEQGFCDFKLLKTTANASLYLAFKAGKRFLIKTTKDNSERQMAMLQREYELSIGCDHPHIIHIYTIESLPVGMGLVMEYIEGRTLAEYLAEQPEKKERNRIFEELLSAVAYLHKRGVIHNDIKPENILISRADNSLKLIDFGLADSDAEYAMRSLGCTPRYASPELQSQSGNVDARSDIYSVGILMREIFGNRHRRIAERCCRADVNKRYENIAALYSAWQRRNLPLKVVLGIIAALLFVAPLVLWGNQKFVEQRSTHHREQLFRQIERDVEQIYAVAADSITRAVYYEFASGHIISFFEEAAKYQKANIISIDDEELWVFATEAYMCVLNRCHQRLAYQAKELPIMSQSGLPSDEYLFYASLLGKRKPYTPYRAKR